MRMKKILLFTLAAVTLLASCSKKQTAVKSPDKRTEISFCLDEEGVPYYSVKKNGQEVLSASRMGFVLREADLTKGFEVLNTASRAINETWQQVWGEEVDVLNKCNEMTVTLSHESGMQMNVVFRAFNDGIAFRYELVSRGRMAGDENLTVLDEVTEYQFAEEPEAWSIRWNTAYYEALWKKAPISEKDTACSPITLEFPNGTYGFLHEAALTEWPAENFTFDGKKVGIFLTPWRASEHAKVPGGVAEAGVKAYVTSPFKTPWRMLILADDLKELLASRIMLNLNEPCAIEDTDWIRPMKFIGIWWGMHLKTMTWEQGPIHGATTENMTRYMRFAAEHNIGGVLAEGWNLGWEDWKHFDFMQPYPDYDIDSIARLSDEIGVQVVGHNETGGAAAQYEEELEDIYAYHDAHGIHAIKTGYVSPIIRTTEGLQWNKGQAGVRHYRKVIETAAKYHICIDNHEPVMPTGLQRTYPNLFTQEGVRGQEWNAWSRDGGSPCEHVTVLPFTRVMAGPVDYTPGVFNFDNPIQPNTRVHSTLMNQLGLFVVIYSPLQMACDLPENYMKYPDAFRFIEHVPCDWKHSELLDGKIGDFIVMARQDKHSDNWYVGGVTDEEARDFTLDFAFLGKGEYTATVYRDAEDAEWESNPYAYVIEEVKVTKDSKLPIRMAAGGGFAVEVVKD